MTVVCIDPMTDENGDLVFLVINALIGQVRITAFWIEEHYIILIILKGKEIIILNILWIRLKVEIQQLKVYREKYKHVYH